jgi:3'-5' exoribonuclease
MLTGFISQSEKLMGQPFPTDLRLRVMHMLLSHHGSLEFGSPRVPMTPEAIALHQIDLLDSRMNMTLRHMREDRAGGPWTPLHSTLQRRLYRGALQGS